MAKVLLYRLTAVVIGSLLTILSSAQYQLRIFSIPPANETVAGKLKLKSSFKSRIETQQYLQQLPVMLQSRGYLSASVDSVSEKENELQAFLFLGEQYKWSALHITPDSWQLLEQLGYIRNEFEKSNYELDIAISINNKKLIIF